MVSPASVTAVALTPHGAALLKCNDTGDLTELVPPPPESGGDGTRSDGDEHEAHDG
jgi:hypothetical protein